MNKPQSIRDELAQIIEDGFEKPDENHRTADAILASPVIRRLQADALRNMASRVRAEWAAEKRFGGWVGALDDEADRIENEEHEPEQVRR
ncbi:hypothetical protein [Microbacterium sp. LWH11-1.2]|uniref:hypothetical protein n=1 Tax=Microbacterium sp. LWH11-1.2 TaxID=3135258 RepID=UPI003138A54F